MILGATGISADGQAGRSDVGSLAVTNVVTAMCSTDEAKARPTGGARQDVAGEVVTQLVDLNVEELCQLLLDLQCSIAADHHGD